MKACTRKTTCKARRAWPRDLALYVAYVKDVEHTPNSSRRMSRDSEPRAATATSDKPTGDYCSVDYWPCVPLPRAS